jgi:hypothetical protein
MKRLVVIFILLLAFGKVNSQDSYHKELKYKWDSLRKSGNKGSANPFIKIHTPADELQNSAFNYPLNDGDFWEYIEKDTITFPYSEHGYFQILQFSKIKEIIGDTVMPNGLKYN